MLIVKVLKFKHNINNKQTKTILDTILHVEIFATFLSRDFDERINFRDTSISRFREILF